MVEIKFPLVLLLLVVGGILFFAFSPGHWTPAWIVNHDKFVHLAVFFLLSIFLSYVFSWLTLSLHFVLLFLFAVLIEAIQYSLFSRGFSVEDILFGLVGVLFFYMLVGTVKLLDHLKLL